MESKKAEDLELDQEELFNLMIRHNHEAGELQHLVAFINSLRNDARNDAYSPDIIATPPLQQNAIGQMLAYDNLLEIIDNVVI